MNDDTQSVDSRNYGMLFVVATPIGNLQDITLRALETLKNAGAIVCEDTRVTSVLLKKYEIKKDLIALNEFNEEHIIYKILSLLQSQNIALVSDAGTPLISDPGYRLVNEAKKRGVRIVPIPGASSVIAALSASGLPTDKFAFLGFLPKSSAKSKKILMNYKAIDTTIVLFESPHRIIELLKNLKDLFGDIEITIGRELTKIYEEISSCKISEFEEKYTKKAPKGEFVVLFSTRH